MANELKDIQDGRAALERLSARERELRAAHAAKLLERGPLASAFAPVDEVAANMRALVDEESARWAQDERLSILGSCSGRYALQRDGSLQFTRPALPDIGAGARGVSFRDLCGLIPDLVKAGLEKIIRSQDYDSTPGPMDERLDRIAEVDREVLLIEAEHTALVDAAADVGISMPLLDPVRERRQAEEARARRDAGALEHRRDLEGKVNASPAARRHSTPYVRTDEVRKEI